LGAGSAAPAVLVLTSNGAAASAATPANWLRPEDHRGRCTVGRAGTLAWVGLRTILIPGFHRGDAALRTRTKHLQQATKRLIKTPQGIIKSLAARLQDSETSERSGSAEKGYARDRKPAMPCYSATGRSVATAKGRRIGRPSVVDPHKLAYAQHLREAGDTIAEIVAKTGITRSSLYRHLPPRPADTVTAAGTNPTRSWPGRRRRRGRSPGSTTASVRRRCAGGRCCARTWRTACCWRWPPARPGCRCARRSVG
jgi:helix-turn-helix resolvase-like protein